MYELTNQIELVILSIIQGITEFFPISSSGHLALFQNLFGFNPSNTLEINVLLHLATFISILLYFRDDIENLIYGLFHNQKSEILLTKQIIVATVPAVIFGLLIKDYIDKIQSPILISSLFIFTALYFLVAENNHGFFKVKNPYIIAFIIGLAQALAILPGVSRSGSTLAMALLLGLDRIQGAKFSFLIGLPAIFGAALLTFFDAKNINAYLSFDYLIAFAICTLVGYFAIKYLMKFYQNKTLKPFAFYLLFIGILILS